MRGGDVADVDQRGGCAAVADLGGTEAGEGRRGELYAHGGMMERGRATGGRAGGGGDRSDRGRRRVIPLSSIQQLFLEQHYRRTVTERIRSD